MKKTLTIGIPAYNEEKNIRDTFLTITKAHKKFKDLNLDIIIINDGSKDRTAEIADEIASLNKNVLVIHNEINEGLGVGFRKALASAKGEYFLFVPGDNDLPVELLVSLFAEIGKADIIISYFLNREVRGRIRNTISIIYNTVYMVTFGVFVFYINGPAIYHTEKLKQLNLNANRFSIIVEATIKILCSGATFLEVPGKLQTGSNGSTAMSFRNLREVIKAFFLLIWEVKYKNKNKYSNPPVRNS